MEGEGWIVRLPRDAHEAHAGALSPKGVSVEYVHHDCVANPKPEKGDREKDLQVQDRESKRRRFNPSVGVLQGRPVLRDVFNDIIDLT